MKQKINILIIGGGMYVAGKGSSSYGTIMLALLEARRKGWIDRLGVVTTSADSANENRDRVNNLAQQMGVGNKCDYFPKQVTTKRLI